MTKRYIPPVGSADRSEEADDCTLSRPDPPLHPPECQKCGMGMLVATKEQFAARICGSCERTAPSTPPSPRTTTDSTCAEQPYRVGEARDIKGDSVGNFDWDSAAEVPPPSSPPPPSPTQDEREGFVRLIIESFRDASRPSVDIAVEEIMRTFAATPSSPETESFAALLDVIMDDHSETAHRLLALYNRQREEIARRKDGEIALLSEWADERAGLLATIAELEHGPNV